MKRNILSIDFYLKTIYKECKFFLCKCITKVTSNKEILKNPFKF